MFSYFRKPQLPTTLFIIAAFVSLLTIIILYIAINFSNYNLSASNETPEYYYLKDRIEPTDPLITKRPDLKSLLAGPIISPNDPSLGDISSPITIVQYSDFQCHYCSVLEKQLKQIIEKYQGKIRLIWKDYPDSQADSPSFLAAKAARCADRQGYFWLYHDLLFASEQNLKIDTFYQFAKQLDLDLDSFTACFQGSTVENLIYSNIKEANALDINGVPFVYINDQEMMGQFSAEDFDKIIKLELSKQSNAE